MKKVSLAERILKTIKGGDEAKLIKFETKIEKYLNNQKKERVDAIDLLNDKIEDANEKLQELILNDSKIIEAIKFEGGVNYVPEYIKKISNQLEFIDELQEKLDKLNLEIERLDLIESTIFEEE